MTHDTVQTHHAHNRGASWTTLTLAAVLIGLTASTAQAASFGGMQLVNNVRVASIFRGAYGPAYITFTPAILTGCSSTNGGYLSSMWSEAITWTPDPDAAKDQLALLMQAKATDALLEVRYRINSSGTGWDKCAVDAVWVQ